MTPLWHNPGVAVAGGVWSDGRVRIIVFASGSRGDVQPLVALALGLQRAGHDVTVAAPGDFAGFVEGRGLPFHGFSAETREILSSDLGRSWLGHSSHRAMLELKLLTQMMKTVGLSMVDEVLPMVGAADVFVSGLLTVDGTDAIVRAGGGRHVLALLAPFAPSRAGWAGLQSPFPRSVIWNNRVAGQTMNWFLAKAFGSPGREIRRRLGLPRASRRDWSRLLVDTPTVVGVSPAVLPPPADWPEHIAVTGYWFLDGEPGYRPSAELEAFLAGGEAPVYVGFGSMSTHDAAGTTELVLSALARSGRRGVVHRGAAGLSSDELPDGVLLVDDVPHDWLFPRCAAVIHHGGAGTTAAALRAGVPSGAVAHMGDQPYWGRRIHELGVGAKPLRRHEATPERLAAMISTLVGSADLAARAAELGERIRTEDGVAVAVSAIERLSAG